MTALSGENEALISSLSKIQEQAKAYDKDNPMFSSFDLVGACKEIIFDIKEDKTVFHAISYSFGVDTAQIILEHVFTISFDDHEGEDLENEIIKVLGSAAGLDVPVYPNTESLQPELARYHRKMLIEGFTTLDTDGDEVRVKLTKSPGKDADSLEYLKAMRFVDGYAPTDLYLMRQAVLKELSELKSAEKVLSFLQYATEGLKKLLSSEKRNENALQEWLTQNPILFGTKYTQVIPKHRLGAEFEMDYALVRHSGLVDLVEIESSNLNLFTQKGNPSQYLVHAEQQVMDWIDWIEAHGEYARTNLPGAYSPKAFVIIGRNSALDENQKSKLRRRNLLFQGKIELLTYDDLLSRATSIRGQFTALEQFAQG